MRSLAMPPVLTALHYDFGQGRLFTGQVRRQVPGRLLGKGTPVSGGANGTHWSVGPIAKQGQLGHPPPFAMAIAKLAGYRMPFPSGRILSGVLE